MRRWLLLAFLITIAVDWPALPFNARLTDIIFVAAAIAVVAAGTRGRPAWTTLDTAVAGYLAGSAMAMLLSPEPRAGVVELIRHVYLAAIYAVVAMATRQGLSATVGTGLAWSGGALVIVGLVSVLLYYLAGVRADAVSPVTSLPYVGETLRLSALTATAAMLACVLTVSAPFLLLHPAVVSSRLRWWGAAVGTGMVAALTFSHAIAGIATSVTIACWNQLRRKPARAVAVAAAAAIVLAFNFAATVSIRAVGDAYADRSSYKYAVDGGRAEIAGLVIEYETMSYWRLKELAWEAFVSRPIGGIGLDRFHAVTESAYQQGRLTESYRVIDPHSTLMGRFAEAGVIGGVTLIALWVVIAIECRRLRQRRPSWLATAAAAALLGTLINSVNVDVMNFRFAWVTLGLVRGLRDLD